MVFVYEPVPHCHCSHITEPRNVIQFIFIPLFAEELIPEKALQIRLFIEDIQRYSSIWQTAALAEHSGLIWTGCLIKFEM